MMDYVDGCWIDRYCDSRRLDIPSRLRLFVQVCEAVHFAHQHAVIHCDLKPSNILVTGSGVPKLVDFGIIEMVHPEFEGDHDAGADPAAPLTPTGEVVLTPEYASPEQVKGEPVTTASDIYALGVVLYRLLTDRWPYQVETESTSEVLKAICEQVPERPSKSMVRLMTRSSSSSIGMTTVATSRSPSEQSPETTVQSMSPTPFPTLAEIAAVRGTTPKGLTRILTGDLDAIVSMTLHKEPDRRYASADQFADDVRNHLERPASSRAPRFTGLSRGQVRAAEPPGCCHRIGPGPATAGWHCRHNDGCS